jgi:hypothetical protein
LSPEIKVPEGWKLERNRFGNPKLLKGEIQVDLFPIASVYQIVRDIHESRHLTIFDHLKGVPFTIQCMAYDVLADEIIITQAGRDAFLGKDFMVNDLDTARNFARLRNQPLNQIISLKARQLDFTPHFVTE